MSEKKLKEAEAKINALINYAGDAIFMIDEKFRIIEVNKSACDLLNYSGEELQSMKMYELMTGDDQKTFVTRIKIIDEKGGSVHERKLKRKDGSFVDTEANVCAVEGVGYLAIIREITERKSAEAKIKERESQLTAFFENIEGAAAMLDAEKKYIIFNKRFIYDHKLLTNQDPYVGQLVYDLFPGEIQKERLKLLDNVLKGNKEVVEVNYIRNEKPVCYRTSFNPVITDGKVTGISTYSIDLSKSKEAEIKIRENEEKFRMAFMTSQDAFYIGTLNEGRIIDANDSFYDLVGYSREESIGKTTLELNLFVYPEDRAIIVEGLKANGNLIDLELTLRRKNGVLIQISLTINVWQLNNEQVVMAVIRDVTERKLIEKKLIEGEIRFREVLENSLSASYKRNLQTNTYDYLSPVFKKIAGYTQDEMNTMSYERVMELIHPDDFQGVNNTITRATTGTMGLENSLEYRFKHKTDGGYRWLKDEFVVMDDAQGKGVSLIGSVSDITERKQAEIKITEQLDELRRWYEAISDRESRIMELKREVNELLKEAAKPLRYEIT
jgi:PAS domain S-box-containing protein